MHDNAARTVLQRKKAEVGKSVSVNGKPGNSENFEPLHHHRRQITCWICNQKDQKGSQGHQGSNERELLLEVTQDHDLRVANTNRPIPLPGHGASHKEQKRTKRNSSIKSSFVRSIIHKKTSLFVKHKKRARLRTQDLAGNGGQGATRRFLRSLDRKSKSSRKQETQAIIIHIHPSSRCSSDAHAVSCSVSITL